MTDTSTIADQMLKVADLKREWDTACAKFDRTGTLPALLDMTAAMRELVQAEDELLEAKAFAHYDPYQAKNVRPFDPDQAEAYELAHPGACM
jgi:hypothetical protein